MTQPVEPTPPTGPVATPTPSLLGQPPAPTPTPATPQPTPSADPKPGEQKPAEAKPAEAPAYVEFKLEDIKLPEGMKLDEGLAKEFVALANTHKMDPAVRNALIELQTKSMQLNSEAGSQAWKDMQEKWRTETMADPEIGGANWTKHAASIGQVLNTYGSPEARQALDMTGAGNNPHVVRMFAKIAAKLVEPGAIPALAPGVANIPPEQVLFPSMNKS